MSNYCTKRTYVSLKDVKTAKNRALSRRRNHPDFLRHYYCKRCRGYHLTHKKAIHAHDPEALQAAFAIDDLLADLKAPPVEFMWMPAGVHQINASKNGKPFRARVEVVRQTADVLNATLAAFANTTKLRPYFDFNHDDKEASAWPVAFHWREQPAPGVYVQVEWSAAGAAAIAGREYRAFSPAFYLDKGKPARVTGSPVNMGGLVNNPAFKEITPIWAKEQNTMNKLTKLLALMATISGLQNERNGLTAKTGEDNTAAIKAKDAEITAKIAEADGLCQEVQAEIEDGSEADAVKAREAERDLWKAKAQQAEQRELARREADAAAAVKKAVERGALPAQDETVQAKWRKLIAADPSNEVLLANLPDNPAMGTVVKAKSGATVQTLKADTKSVIKAYKEADTPEAKAAIWASDIRPRLDEGDAGVIRAANSLGSVTGELIVQRSLDLLKLEFPLLSRISTNFSNEGAAFNQTIKTRLRVPPAVTNYSTSTGYSSSDATTTDVPVTIDQHIAVQVEFNANEMASTSRLLIEEQKEGMHYSLGEAVMNSLYALITSGNFTNATTQALNGFARPSVIAMATAMNGPTRKVPKVDRSLLLNSSYYGKLAEDTTIVSVLNNPNGGAAITTGRLPEVHGFMPIEVPNLPTTANLTGFGLSPSALALAARTPNDYTQALPEANGGGVVSIITNPDTKLTVMMVQFIDHKLGKAIARVALMYGVAKGDVLCGQRLISA
jgi:hypothetical protein